MGWRKGGSEREKNNDYQRQRIARTMRPRRRNEEHATEMAFIGVVRLRNYGARQLSMESIIDAFVINSWAPHIKIARNWLRQTWNGTPCHCNAWHCCTYWQVLLLAHCCIVVHWIEMDINCVSNTTIRGNNSNNNNNQQPTGTQPKSVSVEWSVRKRMDYNRKALFIDQGDLIKAVWCVFVCVCVSKWMKKLQAKKLTFDVNTPQTQYHRTIDEFGVETH